MVGVIIGLAIIVAIVTAALTRRNVMDLDITARRIRLRRSYWGKSLKTIFDVSFDDCASAGLYEANTEGHISHTPIIRLKNGRRYPIPEDTIGEIRPKTPSEVLRMFCEKTGLARVDETASDSRQLA